MSSGGDKNRGGSSSRSHSSNSSSSEEEWQDAGMDFTKHLSKTENTSAKVRKKEASSHGPNAEPDRRRRKGDSKGTRAAAIPAAPGTRSSGRDKTRAASTAAAKADDAQGGAKADKWLPSASGSKRSDRQDSGDMDALDKSEDEQHLAGRHPVPRPLLSPGGVHDVVALVFLRDVFSFGERNDPTPVKGRLVTIAGTRGVQK